MGNTKEIAMKRVRGTDLVKRLYQAVTLMKDNMKKERGMGMVLIDLKMVHATLENT